MFRRLFWLVLGVVLGVLAWRKLTQVVHSYTPTGLSERATAGAERAGVQWRSFVGDVRSLASAREAELRLALGTDERPKARRAQHSGRRRGDGREFRDRTA